MLKNGLIIIGAGGHAKVVTEIINSTLKWDIVAYLDENPNSEQFLGKPIFTTLSEIQIRFPQIRHAFVAIGSNDRRRDLQQILEEKGMELPCLVSPSAELSPSATLENGTLVASKAFIGAAAKIGKGVIVNTGAIVDHDSIVKDFSHLSQGVIVCGGAQVGALSLVGPGCIIEKLANIPTNSTIKYNHREKIEDL